LAAPFNACKVLGYLNWCPLACTSSRRLYQPIIYWFEILLNGSFGPNSNSPVATFAGSRYTLNLTEDIGTIRVRSAWSNAKIGSTVYATVLVAVYEVDKVLLPSQIFKSKPVLV